MIRPACIVFPSPTSSARRTRDAVPARRPPAPARADAEGDRCAPIAPPAVPPPARRRPAARGRRVASVAAARTGTAPHDRARRRFQTAPARGAGGRGFPARFRRARAVDTDRRRAHRRRASAGDGRQRDRPFVCVAVRASPEVRPLPIAAIATRRHGVASTSAAWIASPAENSRKERSRVEVDQRWGNADAKATSRPVQGWWKAGAKVRSVRLRPDRAGPPEGGGYVQMTITLARSARFRRPGRGGEDRVEQQAKRGVRLPAMLDPEAEQDHPTGADPHFHGCRPAGEPGLALEPAAHQQILAAVPRDHADIRCRPCSPLHMPN